MSQLIEIPFDGTTRSTPKYEGLLHERIELGRLYVDAICHRAQFGEAELLFDRVSRLDGRLDRTSATAATTTAW